MHRVEDSKLFSVRSSDLRGRNFRGCKKHHEDALHNTLPPHREVGSDGRLLASSRAIPSGAVTLRSLPLSQSGCPSLLGPCLLVVSAASASLRWLQSPRLAAWLPESGIDLEASVRD
jgi:hypothetical protein